MSQSSRNRNISSFHSQIHSPNINEQSNRKQNKESGARLCRPLGWVERSSWGPPGNLDPGQFCRTLISMAVTWTSFEEIHRPLMNKNVSLYCDVQILALWERDLEAREDFSFLERKIITSGKMVAEQKNILCTVSQNQTGN